MAVYKKESGICTGRGFSNVDPTGFLAKFLSWSKRPAVDGSSQNFTADAPTDVITAAGHGYVTGESVKLTTTGTLPGGLSLSTEYYVIYVDANTFKLASTYNNAVDGTQINILDAGTGTHSVYAMGGGPGWFLIEDKSNPASKTFTADSSTEKLTIAAGHIFGTGDRVRLTTTGTLPGGLSAGTDYYTIYVSSTEIKLATSRLNAETGTVINITSSGSGTHTISFEEKYIVICDTASPTVNDIDTGPSGLPPKFIKMSMIINEAAIVRFENYMWWDSTTHDGRGFFSRTNLGTTDSGDFSYYFYGGAESMFLVTRRGTTWNLAFETDFVYDANLSVEGTDKFGTIQSGVTAGSNVTLQLDTGEASNFTADNYYFIYDFNGHTWVDCVKCVSVDGGADTIIVDTLTYNYPAGAKIASYAHRLVAGGEEGVTLPYYNVVGHSYVFNDQNTNSTYDGHVYAQVADKYLDRLQPNRKGNYAVSEIGITEFLGHNISPGVGGVPSSQGHEAYGVIKNCLASVTGSMSAGLDGRVDQGLNYIYFGRVMNNIFYNGSFSYAILILDTESDS